jgi:hypothetical protein
MSNFSKETPHPSEESNGHLQKFIRDPLHELRTHLTTIMSSASILEYYYQRLNEEQRQKHFAAFAAPAVILANLLDTLRLWSTKEEHTCQELPRSMCLIILSHIEPATMRLLELISELDSCGVKEKTALLPQMPELVALVKHVDQAIQSIDLPSYESSNFLQTSDEEHI